MNVISRLAAVFLSLTAMAAHAQSTVEYFHTDALGSPVAVTDAVGNVIERNEYEPYGADLTGIKDGPGYAGHVGDAQTGLSYMQQRYYDPQIGRFLSVDPVTADGGTGGNFNRYKYAANNPYRFVDPDGRFEKTTGSHIGGGGFAGSRLYGGIIRATRSSMDTGPNKQTSPEPLEPSQENVNKSIEKHEIDTHGADVFYDRSLEGAEGTVVPPETILIGPGAFKSDSYLGQTIYHETVHIEQTLQRRDRTDRNGAAMNEAEAYKRNINAAARFRSSPADLAGYEAQFHSYYDGLPQGLKQKVDSGN